MDADHSRTIVHIDLDCFYAQVEMLKLPDFKERPLGVTQKSLVVTCNYAARAKGVGKCMPISEARKLCPEIKLVCGEDLAEYRRMSNSVHSLLSETQCPVERLGMDENWIDISNLVGPRLKQSNLPRQHVGHLLGELSCDSECDCEERLAIGSVIASELRAKISSALGLSSSAGVSYNKLLAKVGGSRHKPDQQTIVPPGADEELVLGLGKVSRIPGVGSKMKQLLANLGVETVEQLKRVDLHELKEGGIEEELAKKMKMWAVGMDESQVKTSGRQKILGLEDTFVMKGLESKEQCREQMDRLVARLGSLLQEDGRVPLTLKISVRDANKNSPSKKFVKESRQCKVSGRLWTFQEDQLSDLAKKNVVDKAMELLGKVVTWEDKFLITLLGVAVADFVEHVKNNISSFFAKQEKCSILTVKSGNNSNNLFEPNTCFYDQHSLINSEKTVNPKVVRPPEQIKYTGGGFFSKFSDKRKRKLDHSEEDFSLKDNKIAKVEKESQNMFGRDKEISMSPNVKGKCDESLNFLDHDLECPSSYDQEVWKQLPKEIRRDILLEHKASSVSINEELISHSIDPRCPSNCDPSIFKDLPDDIKEEIVRSSKVVTSCCGEITECSGICEFDQPTIRNKNGLQIAALFISLETGLSTIMTNLVLRKEKEAFELTKTFGPQHSFSLD